MTRSKKDKSRIPEFKTREEEAHFWDKHDIADYQDEFKTIDAKFVKPSSTVLSVRLKRDKVDKLQAIAQENGIGVTTVIKILVNRSLNTMKGNQMLKIHK